MFLHFIKHLESYIQSTHIYTLEYAGALDCQVQCQAGTNKASSPAALPWLPLTYDPCSRSHTLSHIHLPAACAHRYRSKVNKVASCPAVTGASNSLTLLLVTAAAHWHTTEHTQAADRHTHPRKHVRTPLYFVAEAAEELNKQTNAQTKSGSRWRFGGTSPRSGVTVLPPNADNSSASYQVSCWLFFFPSRLICNPLFNKR